MGSGNPPATGVVADTGVFRFVLLLTCLAATDSAPFIYFQF